jgi:FkbM family methyltransferase
MAYPLRSLLRDLTPPIAWKVLDGLRSRFRAPRPPPDDPFSIRASTPGAVEFYGAGRFEFRAGSAADAEVVQQVFVRREYSVADFHRGEEIARLGASMEDPLIVDCGANIGAASVWFTVTFPRARVLAIEPEAGNFAFLERNSALRPRVTPIRGAIAGIPGELSVTDPGIGEWGYRTSTSPTDDARLRVRAWTVRELVEAHGGTPFILKIDVEGAEADLFRASDDVLDRFPVVMIELHDWMLPSTANSRNFIVWQAGRDRDLLIRAGNLFSLANGQGSQGETGSALQES